MRTPLEPPAEPRQRSDPTRREPPAIVRGRAGRSSPRGGNRDAAATARADGAESPAGGDANRLVLGAVGVCLKRAAPRIAQPGAIALIWTTTGRDHPVAIAEQGGERLGEQSFHVAWGGP